MGIQKSNLDHQKIIEILKQEYNINCNKITKIDTGTANLFKIETDNVSYILKEFNENIRKETVEKEITMINFLRERNIRVPEYIKLKNSNFYMQHRNNIIIVQKFVDGFMIENNEGTYSQLMECAKTLGKMVKELKEFPELEENTNWCSRQETITRISKMKKLKKEIKDNPYKEKIIQALDNKIEISETMEKIFNFEIINKMTKTNTHGDYNNTQLIFDVQGLATVIDFEKARKMPISYEVMESYCFFDKEAKNGILNLDTLIKYFQEFTKYFPLNKYDLQYAPHIFLIRLANSSYGFEEYNNDNNQIRLLKFAIFRANLSKYLYDNLDKISLLLSKNGLIFS